MLPIIVNVETGDVLVIQLPGWNEHSGVISRTSKTQDTDTYLPRRGIVESLDHLDSEQQIQNHTSKQILRQYTYIVLFPEPLAPARAINVPGSTVNDRPRNTGISGFDG